MTTDYVEVYKIRRMSDGLFSTGGSYPRFTKVGKIWKRPGDVTNHLNVVHSWGNSRVYGDCEIVKYRLENHRIDGVTVERWMRNRIEKREREAQEALERREAREQAERKQLYEELKREFECPTNQTSQTS